MKNVKLKARISSQQASSPARSSGKSGIRRPEGGLKWLLELVNLVPPEMYLPEDTPLPLSLLRGDASNLQLHLRQLAERPEEWPYQPEDQRAIREGVFKRYGVTPDDRVFTPEKDRITCQLLAIQSRYRLIRRARENLFNIAEGRDDEVVITARLGRNRGKLWVEHGHDEFAAAIHGQEDCIRICSACGRLHFAGRLTHQGKEIEPRCSPECGHKLRNSLAEFLRANGYPANVKLTKREEAAKALLVDRWRKELREKLAQQRKQSHGTL